MYIVKINVNVWNQWQVEGLSITFAIDICVHFKIVDGSINIFAVSSQEKILFLHTQKILWNTTAELIESNIPYSTQTVNKIFITKKTSY